MFSRVEHADRVDGSRKERKDTAGVKILLVHERLAHEAGAADVREVCAGD